MNDFYSFLRFALPGISSSTELLIFVSLSLNISNIQSKHPQLMKELSLSLEIAIFTLFIFGIGFIYNLIYRTIPCMKVDYSAFAKALDEQKLISLSFFDFKSNESVIKNITKENSWGIVNTLWHSRRGNSKLIKETTERSEKFAHLLHNSATSLIGFLIASIIFLFLLINFHDEISICGCIFALIIAFLLGYAHWLFFYNTLRDFRRFVEVILYADLTNNKPKKNTKTFSKR
ncbi:hypothetical protein [Leptospira bandrabouensis]|uniref:hypothetical protein n=1 Tax=Leptospira bandrabouensis TaxID=2484903 RepID=UPI001EEC8CB4|nr:hypothetical protein [Leptospira bandrabouensis]MCG6146624.1 hypothetical protein [Leptospira bandrabouensis]MCG6166189.1 hypothetical protein [Leptospira bandrabouensis]